MLHGTVHVGLLHHLSSTPQEEAFALHHMTHQPQRTQEPLICRTCTICVVAYIVVRLWSDTQQMIGQMLQSLI